MEKDSPTAANDGTPESKPKRVLLRLLAVLTGLLPAGLLLLWSTGREIPELPTGHRALTNPERFAESADTRILLVGNSLARNNDLAQLVEKLAEAAIPDGRDVYAAPIAPAGYRLEQHRTDLLDQQRNPPLRQALISGSEAVRDWDFVILQPQSQIPGFAAVNAETSDLFSAATTIHDIVDMGGATTVLLMTWGFWNGDIRNILLYPDFMTMSRRLEAGYVLLASRLASTNSKPCVVAPVGLAFRAVFEEESAMGIDPKSAGSLFRGLYVDDRHPSLAGSYLAAAVLVGTIMAVPVGPAAWVPQGLDSNVAARLRRTADSVVSGSNLPYGSRP